MSIAYSYDYAGRMTGECRHDSKCVSYAYDKAGNRTQITWPDGWSANYIYDGLHRLQKITDNSNAVLRRYYYDRLGRVMSVYNGGDRVHFGAISWQVNYW